MGLLNWGLYDTAEESVIDESSYGKAMGRVSGWERRVDSFTCLAGAMVVKDLLWYGSFL